MRKILEQCPTCGGPLIVIELECAQCQTQVRGRYAPCTFCSLTADQLEFVRLFVQSRGNLREMEKLLGVSYPTVRGKLDEIAERLGAAPAPAEAPPPPMRPTVPEEERQELLRLIAEGKLSPKEALARLRRGQDSGGEVESAQ